MKSEELSYLLSMYIDAAKFCASYENKEFHRNISEDNLFEVIRNAPGSFVEFVGCFDKNINGSAPYGVKERNAAQVYAGFSVPQQHMRLTPAALKRWKNFTENFSSIKIDQEVVSQCSVVLDSICGSIKSCDEKYQNENGLNNWVKSYKAGGILAFTRDEFFRTPRIQNVSTQPVQRPDIEGYLNDLRTKGKSDIKLVDVEMLPTNGRKDMIEISSKVGDNEFNHYVKDCVVALANAMGDGLNHELRTR